MERTPSARLIASTLLISMQLTGFIGLQWEATRSLFLLLTPFHLLATALLVFAFAPEKNRAFYGYLGLAFTVGLGVEILGVQTGLIFGSYQYGPTLGVGLLGVPLQIGVNWAVLTYVTGIVANQLAVPKLVKALAGAGLLTLLDFFVEPVAVRYDFWQWQNNLIPVQNYVAWFGVSLGLLLVFYQLNFRKQNPLALLFYLLQLLFFAGHWLTAGH